MTRRPTRLLAGVLTLILVVAACSADGGREADRGAAPKELAVAEFAVDGMTCGGCALATEVAVRKLDGVTSAEASYDAESGEGRCTVEYDPATVTPDRIADAIRGAGFQPRLQPDGSG